MPRPQGWLLFSSSPLRGTCWRASAREPPNTSLPIGDGLYTRCWQFYDKSKGEPKMFLTIVSASILTAIVSLVCIVGIPYIIAPTPWGARVLTGSKTPFGFLLSGHVVIFMLATLVGLIVGWLTLLRGRVPNSFFWILAVVALAASLVELLTDLGWLAEKVMRKPSIAFRFLWPCPTARTAR